jgi:FkbM family methyltransferase
MTDLYYFNNDYTKPIKLDWYNDDYIVVSSSYWNSDVGTFNNLRNTITFDTLGSGVLHRTYIDFGTSKWHKDCRKNILFIGANDMHEIGYYVHEYNNGLFIEATPHAYGRLKRNLKSVHKFNTNYIPINKLVTSEDDKEYTFNIFDNNEGSSSIYSANPGVWKWSNVNLRDKIKLKSTRIENILKQQNWQDKIFDLVIDVQGAELEVLKGFSSHNLNNIRKLTVEVSTQQFYIGGVLFDELNSFLVNNKFRLISNLTDTHCDVVYERI